MFVLVVFFVSFVMFSLLVLFTLSRAFNEQGEAVPKTFTRSNMLTKMISTMFLLLLFKPCSADEGNAHLAMRVRTGVG